MAEASVGILMVMLSPDQWRTWVSTYPVLGHSAMASCSDSDYGAVRSRIQSLSVGGVWKTNGAAVALLRMIIPTLCVVITARAVSDEAFQGWGARGPPLVGSGQPGGLSWLNGPPPPNATSPYAGVTYMYSRSEGGFPSTVRSCLQPSHLVV